MPSLQTVHGRFGSIISRAIEKQQWQKHGTMRKVASLNLSQLQPHQQFLQPWSQKNLSAEDGLSRRLLEWHKSPGK